MNCDYEKLRKKQPAFILTVIFFVADRSYTKKICSTTLINNSEKLEFLKIKLKDFSKTSPLSNIKKC
jgi:hypothetical protein